ncbi:thiamine pyrophosphate-binding protein [Citricoccus zhacaiensis]|uniref:thiamine pyrophosphate-binding protein n=1 Tax=Citricoccus zhacaiensis TaxID=489142 RepID=UPI00166C6F1B|nr:thiamine pyrophosphate-binding protein [Citricoccus zhacaiensis]
MNTSQYLGRFLAEWTPTLFGLMGDANMRYLSEYMDRGGRFVTVAHEAAAVSMADGRARVTGAVGTASVTHGPGFTNTLTALTEAARYRSPIVVFTGSTRPGRTVFQQFDLRAAADAAGAGFESLCAAATLPEDLIRAYRRARTERRPIVVDFPALLDGEPLPEHVTTASMPVPDHSTTPAQVPPVPAPELIDAAVRAITAIERPVILAGRGALSPGAQDAIGRLGCLLGAPLATTLLARGLFAGHPLDIGLMGGLSFGPTVDLLREADGFIVFGAGLNAFTAGDRTNLLAGRTVIQIDSDPAAFEDSGQVDVAVLGDAGAAAEALARRLPDSPDRVQESRQRAAAVHGFNPRDHYRTDWTGYGLSVRDAALALQEVLPADKFVVSDLGRFIATSWRHISGTAPGTFTHTGTFGSIGLGLSTALGAATASERPVIALVGDGGLMMSIGELGTAARAGLPVFLIVFNDGAYGAEYSKLAGYGLDPDRSLMDWPDLATLARGFGWEARTVSSVEEIRALDLTQPVEVPTLLDVRVDPQVDHFEW